MRWIDVRCTNQTRGGQCGRLLLRRDADSDGTVQVKCWRCKAINETRMYPVYNLTT